jgi:hypothetical protein
MVFKLTITNFGLSGLSFYAHDKFSCRHSGWHIKVNHTDFGLKFIFSNWTLGHCLLKLVHNCIYITFPGTACFHLRQDTRHANSECFVLPSQTVQHAGWYQSFWEEKMGAVSLSERLSNYRESVDNSVAFNHHESEIFCVKDNIAYKEVQIR